MEKIQGDTVLLRPLTQSDLPARANWTADDELCALMGVNVVEEEAFVSPEDELQGNREWLEGRQRSGAKVYAIEVGGSYIGDIDISLMPTERKAYISLFIGDRSHWRKGYGSETVILVLDDLKKAGMADILEIDVSRQNKGALTFWHKLGFQESSTDDDRSTYIRLEKRIS